MYFVIYPLGSKMVTIFVGVVKAISIIFVIYEIYYLFISVFCNKLKNAINFNYRIY